MVWELYSRGRRRCDGVLERWGSLTQLSRLGLGSLGCPGGLGGDHLRVVPLCRGDIVEGVVSGDPVQGYGRV